MHHPTVDVYDRGAEIWAQQRQETAPEQARRLAGASGPGPVADLGCGPGWSLSTLGAHRRAIGIDAASGMLELARRRAPGTPLVRCDLTALPFRRAALGGAWASRSYVHLEPDALPLALADLHRSLAPDAPVVLHLFAGPLAFGPMASDDLPGRSFATWPRDLLSDVMTGAGFTVRSLQEVNGLPPLLDLELERAHTLPDTVATGMRLLVCGLNPSPRAAETGIGYAGPANRFWAAAAAAGLVRSWRDPRRALLDDGIGMTDLVKRTTRTAAEISREEFVAGAARLERIVAWLEPRAICMVGLQGWRTLHGAGAQAGRQSEPLGGRPVYVMPSTSGRNAATSSGQLVSHLRAALELADRAA